MPVPHANLSELGDRLFFLWVLSLELPAQLLQARQQLVVGMQQSINRLVETTSRGLGLLLKISDFKVDCL